MGPKDATKPGRGNGQANTCARIPKVHGQTGLITEMQNPEILEYCVRLLLELQNKIKSRGFSEARDCSVLSTIYGTDLDLHGTFRDFYLSWLNVSRVPEQERQGNGYATPEQCKEKVLSEIDAEIRRLRNYQEGLAKMESERTKLEILRRKVPVSERLEVLLRCEARLERVREGGESGTSGFYGCAGGKPLLLGSMSTF